MPDVQPDPTAPLTASPTATLSGANTGTAPAAPEPFRVPQDDPRVWARGKTWAEVAGVTDQMIGALQQSAQPIHYAATPAPSGGVQWQDLKDDEVVDGRTIKQLASQFQQAIQPNQGNAAQLAQMAYESVKREPRRAEIFQRYEPELLLELRQLPAHLWTLDNLRTVADVIGSRHLDELAEVKAQAKFANMQGLPIRADGLGSSAQGTVGLESDGLPTNFQEILAKKGLDLGLVRSFCASQTPPWTVKKWFESEAKMAALGSR